MGGKAFAEASHDGPALHVPRLTPEQYKKVRDECVTKLRTRYPYVEVPPEAPGKDSYGDIDIHFSEGVQPLPLTYKRDGGELLGARRMILHGNSSNYAVPHPDESGAFCQVDVHHVTPGNEKWEMFMQSYGDLMQIVGKFLRYCGLTATDKGLFVRIIEIEQAGSKQAARLFLTRDVEQCLIFIGLDYAKWTAGFATQQDMFEWCCTGKYFSAKAYNFDVENHNDRQRMTKRSAFNEAKDWVLANESLFAASFAEQADLRSRALKDAITTFDKGAEYRAKLETYGVEQAEKAFWQRATDIVPREGDKMAIVRRALKRWVYFDGKQRPSLRSAPEMDQSRQPRWAEHIKATTDDGAVIYGWIAKHWEEAYQKERGRESEEKAKRDAAKNMEIDAAGK